MNIEFDPEKDCRDWLKDYISADMCTPVLNYVATTFGNNGVSDDEFKNMTREEMLEQLRKEYERRFFI